MTSKLCKTCGHENWEHHGECCHVIKKSTERNPSGRKYCDCKGFEVEKINSKLCKCGHEKHYHPEGNKNLTGCNGSPYCSCEKFQPETDVDIFMKNKDMMDKAVYDKEDEQIYDMLKQKKGSSEDESIGEQLLNNLVSDFDKGYHLKQKKGCGKKFCYVEDCNMGCFDCNKHRLCPSCQNQSSYISVVDTSRPGSIPGKNTPEDDNNLIRKRSESNSEKREFVMGRSVSDSSGIQSPQGSKAGLAAGAPAKFKDKPEDGQSSSGTQSPIAMAEDKPVDTANRNEDGSQGPPKVYIERAAKLDKKGIRAVCGTEKEYSDYVKKQKKGNGRMTDPEYTEENKEHFEVSNDDLNWKPCLRCGGELTQKRKAFFECVNCAQGFIADAEDMKK